MTTELGQRISSHRGSFWAGGWGWYVGGISLLASVSWLVRAVEAMAAKDGDVLEPLATAGAALLFGVLFLVVPLLRLLQTVDVFEHGLVHRRPWGETTIRRDQVAGVRRTTHRGRGGTYEEIEIALGDGGAHDVVGVSDAEQLVAFVRSWATGAAPALTTGGQWTPPPAGGWTPPS